VPVRGQRNEPQYIPYVIARLAAVRNSTPDAVAALVTANAQRFFGLAIGAAS
jgi:TatD DNase family protein